MIMANILFKNSHTLKSNIKKNNHNNDSNYNIINININNIKNQNISFYAESTVKSDKTITRKRKTILLISNTSSATEAKEAAAAAALSTTSTNTTEMTNTSCERQNSEQASTTSCGKAHQRTTGAALTRRTNILHDHQCRLPHELHYRYNLKNIYAALIIYFAVILTQTNLVQSRSTSAKLRTFAKSTVSGVTVQQHPAIAAVSATASASIPFSSSSSSMSSSLASSSAAASSSLPKEKFSIETNSIQRYTISDLAAAEGGRSLKRVFLSNRTITCNDGSQAGFYLRKNPNSKKWIVFLEGGWHCYDTRSCRARWLRLRHLMTSAQWPETRDVGGILSPLPEENPYWHNANHVLVPYCSSDSWSGTRATVDTTAEARDNNWRFMGALILRQVIADLIPLGLGRVPGAELLLVGSSAGGLGVMLNLDHITQFLVQERNLMVMVRGVSDSGWFIDREPYTPAAVASSEAVRQGWKLWQGLLPEECTKQHTAEPWRCYFGYHLYPMLKSPLFVFQWLFDEAQMRADNVGAPVTPQQWNYIHEMGGALRSSLDNVTAVFAPSCIGHAVLSKREWVHIKIDDISLPSALRCWEHSTRPRRKRHHDKLKRSTEATLNDDNDEILNNSNLDGLILSPRKQRHRKNKNNNNKNNNNNNNNNAVQRHQKEQQHQENNLKISNNDVEQKQQQKPHVDNIENKKKQRTRQHLTKEQRAERKRRRHDTQKRRRERRRRQRQQQRKKNSNAHNSSNNNNNKTDGFVNRKRKHRLQNNNNNNNNDNNNTTNINNHNNKKKSARLNNNNNNNNNKQQRKLQLREQQQNDDNTASAPEIDALFLQNHNNNNNNNNNDNVLRSTTTVEKELLPYSQTSSSSLSSSSSTTALSSSDTIYELETNRQQHYQNNNKYSNSNKNNNSNNKNNNKSKNLKLPRVPEKCSLRLLERCSWPQCNHSCPSLTNPLTGEEMRFLELLTSFGLDIEAVAAALGVDMHTLNNMDRTELVNLLTQQVS